MQRPSSTNRNISGIARRAAWRTLAPAMLMMLMLGANADGQEVIVNGNFSSGNTGFTSAYTYQTNLYPEGTYYVGANANTYHASWTAFGDHTTGNGLMMIVNGSVTNGLIVWQETVAVTPNSRYVFSAWIASTYPVSPADLEITVNGVSLGILSATTTVGQWVQLSGTWDSGSNASATIRFINRNTVPSGNDFVLDDISMRRLMSVSGTVFEDANYGGGAGRSLASSGGVARSGARVELYNSAGNFVAATTTDVSGQYSFAFLAEGNYTVRVVNSTVTSSRSGYVPSLIGVQTFRTSAGAADIARVGGEDPTRVDAGANTTSATLASLTTGTTVAQSIAPVTLSSADATDVDFGFNFSTIVNANNAGQGSLRQFILNSNALTNGGLAQAGLTAGVETSIFMLSDGAAHPGLRAGLTNLFSGGTATITVTSALPAITDARTAIDGTRQTAITGNTNPAVNESTTGPEITINVAAPSGPGLQTVAANTLFDSIGVTGADGSAELGAGVYFNGAGVGGSIIRNSTLYGNNDAGVTLRNGATSVQVLNNISRNNGLADLLADGIELVAASGNTVSNNQILNNAGYGIDLHTSPSNNNTISGNLIRNNGTSTGNQDAGIAVRTGSNNTISANTITANNQGDGIVVISGTGNRITQNSISANGNLGIDLGGGDTGDGVTLNDANDTDAGANDLLNFPVVTDARISGSNLVLSGFARPGAVLEFFVAAPDPTGFGEGQAYLVTLTEGSGADTDAGTGTYTSPLNGQSVGTDTTNRFSFTIALPAGVAVGTVLTATATLGASTSEFGNNVTVAAASPPNIQLVKSVTPEGTQLPGTELTYTVAFTNTGGRAAANFLLTDPDPATVLRLNTNTDFKLGSVINNLGTSGLTVTVSYSNDNGATFVYVPVSGGGSAPAGYDRNVTHIRWAFAGSLSQIAPNNTGQVSFAVRIR